MDGFAICLPPLVVPWWSVPLRQAMIRQDESNKQIIERFVGAEGVQSEVAITRIEVSWKHLWNLRQWRSTPKMLTLLIEERNSCQGSKRNHQLLSIEYYAMFIIYV